MLDIIFTIVPMINAITTFTNIEEVRKNKKKKETEYNNLSDKDQHKLIMRKFNKSMSS